jgi:hypothetical protein
MTPDQYWNSLTNPQQNYLKKLIIKKNVPLFAGAALVILLGAYYAGKKGLI